MNKLKNKKYKFSQPKELPIFLKILKFITIIFLRVIASKQAPYQPNLQERVMGENIPFSDKYYIPDDQNHP